MHPHVFVDETKDRGYLVAAAVVVQSELAPARQAMKRLVMPGQRRIHFHKESDARRNLILSTVRTLGVQAIIYDASAHRRPKDARDACLVRLVEDLAKLGAVRLVLELDESTLKADQRLLYREVRTVGVQDVLRYDHLRAYEDVLLAVPDAVAWSWAKGGNWRNSVRPLVSDVRDV